MRLRVWTAAAAAAAVALGAGQAGAAAPSRDAGLGPDRLLPAIRQAVSPDRLRETLTRLVGFGTRHTLSDTTSETRGIGAARRWTAARFADVSKACGGSLAVETPQARFTGERLPPDGALIQDVLAVQRGTSDPDRVIVLSAHIDSRVSDVMNAAADAPGADDDGSGVAAVLEAARVLCGRRFAATIVYAVLSGEEQGLFGGRLLAETAKARGWRVEAVLNNDIVGNVQSQAGVIERGYVRVFSEGTKAVETPTEANRRRYNGGEVDSPSRNLARYIAALADRYGAGFRARLIYRTDRFGRGGDQTPMLEAGFPGVRLTEAGENYDRQHQDLRTEHGRAYGDVLSGVDFAYLAQVTRLNAMTAAALAAAPPPPAQVKIEGQVSSDTTVSWTPSPGAASYRVYWRDTTEPFWSHSRDAGAATALRLPGVVIDDWFFGVAAVSADGFESPVEFPGPAGAFFASPPPAAPAAR